MKGQPIGYIRVSSLDQNPERSVADGQPHAFRHGRICQVRVCIRVFENLIGYIERNEIRPVVAKTYALRDVVQAQEDFMAKRFSGKLAIEIQSPAS
ncbi:hypothetical protein [Marinobacter sp.]|uniref:hypothetical protein n=1 Tax=Marinobacter sp. TaxID=50741 RepID=UPI001B66C871|nr:hypothetical protein [Marinobacter sp.]MBQ0834701.1 hypothetical protein [Marinobacter sp.]